MSSFQARFMHFLNVTDPRTLLTSDAKIHEAATALRNCKEQGLQCGTDADMAGYQRLVSATIHPSTKEIIPAPFRVSAIAPMNIPIVWAMLATPASNLPATLALHWINQSYNTACNYCNASGTEQPWQATAKAYFLAVASACGIAFGLGKAFERAPPSVRRFGVIIPCLATAAANCSNLGFTRMGELTTGTPLSDNAGRVVGVSPKAGLVCVSQTAITRCVLVPAACLVLPPLLMLSLKSVRLAPRGPTGLLMLELGIIYASLQAALPAALAVFPQTASFPVEELEPQFRGLVDAQGRAVTTLFANKGL